MQYILIFLHGYRRNVVYPLLGFKNIKFLSDLSNIEYVRWYPDDLSTYKNIISIFENKEKDEKVFNFTLTMQNHSGYDLESYPSTIKYIGEGNYPKLNQYLTIIRESDKAFEYLINYFKEYEEPTIVVIFGDHQPSIEEEFYQYLFEKGKNVKMERKYITPFIIWSNYDIEAYEIKEVSANYLSTLLLEIAGLKSTTYNKFLNKLYKEIPVVTGNGYIDKNGMYHNFDEENQYSELLKEYEILQYNNMFDSSNKVTSAFELK